MERLGSIRQACHARMLSARTINRIVESDDFRDYFLKSSELVQTTAEQFILNGDKDGLESWMHDRRNEFDNAALSIKELRRIAQQLGVKGYNALPKALLLTGIEDVKKKRRCENVGEIDDKDDPQFESRRNWGNGIDSICHGS